MHDNAGNQKAGQSDGHCCEKGRIFKQSGTYKLVFSDDKIESFTSYPDPAACVRQRQNINWSSERKNVEIEW